MNYVPLISIVIPVFNAGKTLQSTIESVLNQSYKNIELIIVDGESVDNTNEIINQYNKNINIFICEKDNGIYDAMNKGIVAASGDWLLFLGGDDVLYDSEILASIFNDSNFDKVDFLYGDVLFKSNSLFSVFLYIILTKVSFVFLSSMILILLQLAIFINSL
jgi:glycosyltransferase involved in cell wall biosynthesis